MLLLLLALCTFAKAEEPFTAVAAIIDGPVYAQKGKVHYTRPKYGDKVKVNDFGQYQEINPLPVFLKFETESQRVLNPNGLIFPGEIVLTTGESFAKILFRDNTLIDVGPGSAFEISEFNVSDDTSKKRIVKLKIAYGKFRVIVPDDVKDGQSVTVYTPNAMMDVHGAEFNVNASTDEEGLSQTDVVCVHGQLAASLAKPTLNGMIYGDSFVVNPSNRFTTNGHNGLTRELATATMSQEQLREAVKSTSPQVNVFATWAAHIPNLVETPGTGISQLAKTRRYPEFKALENKPLMEDMLQPSRRIASVSGNFTPLQKDFEISPIAPGLQRTERVDRYTGISPLDIIPTQAMH